MLYGKAGIHSIVIFKPFAVHEACGTLCRVTGGVGPRPLSWWCCFVRRADTQICQGICFSVSSLAFLVSLSLCLLFVSGFILASSVQHDCTVRSHSGFCFLTFSSLHSVRFFFLRVGLVQLSGSVQRTEPLS